MPTYPFPQDNHRCQCYPDPMAMMFCKTGHMTESHYPYDCGRAGCGHLSKYDLLPEEACAIQARAAALFAAPGPHLYTLDVQGNATPTR